LPLLSYTQNDDDAQRLEKFLSGKSERALKLFHHFIKCYKTFGNIVLYPTSSMVGIGNPEKRIAWITQMGKDFIHVVFPLNEPHHDNLCFTKIAQVPGDQNQFNHHFRMYEIEDVNDEVFFYMLFTYKNQVQQV
jgi:hypothetical protein